MMKLGACLSCSKQSSSSVIRGASYVSYCRKSGVALFREESRPHRAVHIYDGLNSERKTRPWDAAVAQQVERLICNQQVGGSTPSSGWHSKDRNFAHRT